MTPAANLSIVLPTYNRCERLAEALEHHRRTRVPAGLNVEMVIVDNNSSDATRSVVKEFASSAPFTCRYAFEGRQGLGHARNKGYLESTGELVAYVDDDCYPRQDWLEVIYRELVERQDLDGIGGAAYLYDQQDLPLTIRTGTHRFRAEPSNLFYGLPGLNFCVRRSVIESIGLFDGFLGAGSATKSGEDSDFFYRAIRGRKVLEYVPDLVVYHHHGRQSPESEKALEEGYVLGRGAFYMKHFLRLDLVVIRMIYWDVIAGSRPSCDSTKERRSGYSGTLLRGAWAYLAAKARNLIAR